jgi:Animal haem peroxidase
LAKANSVRPHGVDVRGANLSRSSTLFQGRFGRMFRALPPADFGANDTASMQALTTLGAAMVSVPDLADPKDGPDNEESGIPAIYTYFGQFIDHDLTFDPASFLQKQDDPDALVDYRTPAFDLDNVYGRGPDDQPYLYENGRIFILGEPLTGAAANPSARDLPRSQPVDAVNPGRAIIGDPRNDENVIISQLQGLFHRFHNHIALANPAWPFERVQREVRFHYQWVILHDFLPTLVSHEALRTVWPKQDALSPPNLQFFHWRNEPYMPLEFSAASYRFGHSMVRPGYRLSESVPPLSIFAANPAAALTGFRKFPANWAIDWNLFANLEPRDPVNSTRTQLAYKIDTSIVNPLGALPASIASDPPPSLAARNLLRGWRMRLPTGQDVARAMELEPLQDTDIRIGKFTGDPADILGSITDVAGVGFTGNCPLWTYILAETVQEPISLATTQGAVAFEARKLGPVGGRIVAETFAGLLIGDSHSYLAQDPLWRPSLAANGKFGLHDLIKAALS